MKKTIKIIVLAVLCLNFTAHAQDKPADITALKIGDAVPDISINNIINYKGTDGKPATTAKISDFKGKLLVLDFWATWCSPCVAMIPKMDSLQKEFAGHVQFLPVAYQSQKEIQLFLDKFQEQQHKTYNLPDVVGDTVLKKLFPHSYLPHYVWIDKNGLLQSITEFTDVTEKNIKKVLNNENPLMTQKNDAPLIPYDINKPLLVDNNGGNANNLLYHSVLTSYNAGFPCERTIKREPSGGEKILCKNQNILQLFAIAYSTNGHHFDFNLDRCELKVRDKTKLNSDAIGMEYDNWLKSGNGFCYELIVPAALRQKVFELMQQDICRFYPQYKPSIEQRTEKCLILKRLDGAIIKKSLAGNSNLQVDQFGSIVNNMFLKQWVNRLNQMQYFSLPIIDGTDFKEKIDMVIHANLTDLQSINKELAKYGLILTNDTRNIDVLVISDQS